MMLSNGAWERYVVASSVSYALAYAQTWTEYVRMLDRHMAAML
jgi:hypothetical protein